MAKEYTAFRPANRSPSLDRQNSFPSRHPWRPAAAVSAAVMTAMDNHLQPKLFVIDLVAQAALAFCIGLAASMVFAGIALLLAGGA
jgi:hypothetical protein